MNKSTHVVLVSTLIWCFWQQTSYADCRILEATLKIKSNGKSFIQRDRKKSLSHPLLWSYNFRGKSHDLALSYVHRIRKVGWILCQKAPFLFINRKN